MSPKLTSYLFLATLLTLSVTQLASASEHGGKGTPVELLVTLAPGKAVTPSIVHPDGSSSAFTIPNGGSFYVTDISVNRTGVVATPYLVAIAVEQNLGTAIVQRWAFVGNVSANIERNFATPIRFSTAFVVDLLSSSQDSVTVRILGYFTD